MAYFWPVWINYVLLWFLFKTRISSTASLDQTPCSDFCVSRMTTFDMVTTIYWKSNFSQDSSIKYVLKYKCDPPPWTSVSCPRPQWHGNSSEMSCILLTCATSPLNVYCQIEVEAHGNSSTPFVTRSVLYNAYDKNIPSRITDIDISRNSYTSAIIRWRLPVGFCSKYKYCMEFKYHEEGGKANKSVIVSSSQDMNSTVVTGLDPQKYLFYLAIHEELLCSFPIVPIWTTGPFVLPFQNAVAVHSLYLRVLNFNATIYWKQSEFWSLRPTQFRVHYKSVMSSKNWSTSDCVVKNDPAHVFSCQFLTCELSKEEMYEVKVKVNGSRGLSENILSFHPSLENIPDQVRHVTIRALSSTSLQVSWKLEPWFCSNFEYCLVFFYHSDSENKTIEVTKDKQDQHSVVVPNLLPYTKYYFYATTFGSALGCMYQYSHGATGPYTERTLEDVPSSSPVVVCGLCDVVVRGGLRDGIVRWQLPLKNKWNGLPRVFIIEWGEKPEKNYSEGIWNSKTITKTLARAGNLSGLLITKEYFVRVKMCNGNKLCSQFSKEMKIEMSKENIASESGSSHTKTIITSTGVTLAALVIIFGITVFIKLKKRRYRLRTAAHLDTLSPLPELESRSYEDMPTTPISNYSQLSPTEDYSTEETEFQEPDNSSQVEEDATFDIPKTGTVV